MSRNTNNVNDHININHGTDHALGAWFDVTDARYAGTEQDRQGEGYVLEHSSSFGFTTNLIGLTVEDLQNKTTADQNKIIIEKCNAFISTLNISVCKYDKWVEGGEKALSKFENTLFQLFGFADGTNRMKIITAWPDLFINSKNI